MFRSEGSRTWITSIIANCLLATQLTVASPPGEWGTATVAVQFTRMSGSSAGGCLAGYLASCGLITATCAWECW